MAWGRRGVGIIAVLQPTSSQLWSRGAAVLRQVWGPQSDDVVESTTSRPLQTVGTDWEPDPRKRKLEIGADPKVLHRGGRGRTPTSTLSCPQPRNLSSPGGGPHAEEQGGEAQVEAAAGADADLGRGWSWPWLRCCQSGWWVRGG